MENKKIVNTINKPNAGSLKRSIIFMHHYCLLNITHMPH